MVTIGGLGITIYDICKYYKLNMNGVLFRENSASINGGNLRILVHNHTILPSIVIDDCIFEMGISHIGAGMYMCT